MSTRHGRLRASRAAIAAVSSIRLLVVWISPPFNSLTFPPQARIAPQPPGPGLPEQAPSVWMMTCGSLMRVSSSPVAIPLRPSAPVGADDRSELTSSERALVVVATHQRRLLCLGGGHAAAG